MDKEKAEQVVKLLRKMEHNCKYADNYDDPERHDKAEALSLAIDFIENGYSAVEVNDDENTNGNTIRPGYYERSAMQPLEVMQRIMTAEQFKGFLLGNCIKYRMRCENKGQRDSDMYKARQYAYWLEMTKEGRIINPSKDKVPFDYEFRVV